MAGPRTLPRRSWERKAMAAPVSGLDADVKDFGEFDESFTGP
jgi:hypothetical protein